MERYAATSALIFLILLSITGGFDTRSRVEKEEDMKMSENIDYMASKNCSMKNADYLELLDGFMIDTITLLDNKQDITNELIEERSKSNLVVNIIKGVMGDEFYKDNLEIEHFCSPLSSEITIKNKDTGMLMYIGNDTKGLFENLTYYKLDVKFKIDRETGTDIFKETLNRCLESDKAQYLDLKRQLEDLENTPNGMTHIIDDYIDNTVFKIKVTEEKYECVVEMKIGLMDILLN